MVYFQILTTELTTSLTTMEIEIELNSEKCEFFDVFEKETNSSVPPYIKNHYLQIKFVRHLIMVVK